MLKRLTTGLLALPMAVLSACGSPDQPTITDHSQHAAPAPASGNIAAAALPVTSTAAPALIRRYGRWHGALEKYDDMMYRPRQFAAGLTLETGVTGYGTQVVSSAGNFAGWDALSLPNVYAVTLESEPEIVHFTLSRAAKVGLIWRAGTWRPAWLSGWTQSGSVQVTRAGTATTYPVFTKSFSGGVVSLPSVGIPSHSGTQNYSVIVGEQGGGPTPAPAVPAGQTVPVANQTCPAWVHDQYAAVGPDGKNYPTWHPQIDPVYTCYFRHEHGSDPRLAGVNSAGKPLYTPLYGYTAARHGMTEPHQGFKSHVLKNTDGTWWNVTLHMGSSGLGRVCTRGHTFDVGVVAGGALKADVHLMGDFGRARFFPTAGQVQNITGCSVDQNTIRDMGSRTLGSPQTDGYEPWVVDNEYNVTGFVPNFFSIKQTFPMTRCAVVPACTSLENLAATSVSHSGSDRILEFGPTRIVSGNHTRNVGVYYTDPSGAKFLNSGDATATRQFVATGFTSTLTAPTDDTGYCTARDAWTVEFKCQETFVTGDKNIEHSLRSPN